MRNLLTVFFALCTLNTITVSARPAFDYSALRDGTFEQKTVSGVRSLSDGERYTTMSDGRVLCFSYRTGVVCVALRIFLFVRFAQSLPD